MTPNGVKIMVEIEEFELGFVPVTHTASEAAKAALTVLFPQDAQADESSLINQMPTRRFNPQQFDSRDDLYRITLIRDPIARLLSVYSDLLIDRDVLAYQGAVKNAQIDLPTQPDPDFFFQNLDRYCAASRQIKRAVMKQQNFTGLDMSAYDRVYDVAEIDTFWHELSLMTGRRVYAPTPRLDAERIVMRDLSPKSRDIVRREAQGDYQLFNGYFAEAA